MRVSRAAPGLLPSEVFILGSAKGVEGDGQDGRKAEGAAALGQLLAEINSGKGRAQSRAASSPSSPSQSHPHVLNRRGMPPRGRGLHPEALDPTHKRHILICFQKFKPCSSRVLASGQAIRTDVEASSPKQKQPKAQTWMGPHIGGG